jgi:transcriptional regulator with XRE-family HTH domain
MDLDALKRDMKRLNIKQVDLANAFGIDPGKVSLLMSGKRQFKARELDILRSMLAGIPAGVPTAHDPRPWQSHRWRVARGRRRDDLLHAGAKP